MRPVKNSAVVDGERRTELRTTITISIVNITNVQYIDIFDG